MKIRKTFMGRVFWGQMTQWQRLNRKTIGFENEYDNLLIGKPKTKRKLSAKF